MAKQNSNPKEGEYADSSVAYCLMHPARLIILESLREKPRRISEISDDTGFTRSLVCYHLSYLETSGLIESDYVILEPRGGKGYASRQYRCSPKVDAVIEWIVNRLDELKKA